MIATALFQNNVGCHLFDENGTYQESKLAEFPQIYLYFRTISAVIFFIFSSVGVFFIPPLIKCIHNKYYSKNSNDLKKEPEP
jgi:hypothetical protein